MTIQVIVRKWAVTAALAVACGLLAPVAFAGGHGNAYGHGQRGYSNHGNYRPAVRYNHSYSYRYAQPVRYATRPAYGYASYGNAHYGYARPAYGGYGYSYPRRHQHWRAGEVLGAVVAGAVITSLISDAFQPRTTVVERTVYRSDPYQTRYPGPQDDGYDGYYDDRRR